MTIGYCPNCGLDRGGQFRFCTRCGFDFGTMTLPVTAAAGPATGASAHAGETPASTAGQREPLPILVGVCWLVGAAAIGYLALLQLEYSALGLADSADARNLAIWNGVASAITAYFGAIAIIRPTPQRLMGGFIWAVLNVAWGAYQVSQGVTHGAIRARAGRIWGSRCPLYCRLAADAERRAHLRAGRTGPGRPDRHWWLGRGVPVLVPVTPPVNFDRQ